jgi:hypothetical protein
LYFLLFCQSATIHRIREIIETIESANSDEKNAKNLNCDEGGLGIVLEPRHFESTIDEVGIMAPFTHKINNSNI